MIQRPRLYPPWLLVLLCALLLVMRVGGAHLHLCFDGSEPPVAVHLLDAGLHHGEPCVDGGTRDKDVPVGENVLIKLPKLGLEDVPALLLAVLVLWCLLKAPEAPAARSARSVAWSDVHSIRPPPRGPPISLA
ncbi:hypothetical protein [Panacagrimonas sp.]|jgi:hypothetical protein|uniref:hypothetical protein n=1 Tax=Panacagrimonas sp. TaxID=2480088 RepID=UPI003B524B2C